MNCLNMCVLFKQSKGYLCEFHVVITHVGALVGGGEMAQFTSTESVLFQVHKAEAGASKCDKLVAQCCNKLVYPVHYR